MRVLGTVCGGVVAIIVWEIAQGNPYGLAVVSTIVAIIFYYCLLYKAPLRMLAIMSLITMVMVCITSFLLCKLCIGEQYLY